MKRRGDIFGWRVRRARLLVFGGLWLTLLLGAFSSNAQVPAWVQSTNAVEFFTNLSSRLLSAGGYPFDANNIPVYTNDTFVFTPDVRRILQVTANLYDARTNHYTAPGDADLPTVLRPTFRRQVDGLHTNIYIGGFTEVGAVTGPSDPQFAIPLDLNDAADRALAGTVPDQNIYDVPWIIGVKNGFPSFNEFAMQSVAQITRKLQLHRPTLFFHPNATNQLLIVGISNVFAFEGFNSYPSNYARAVQVIAANDMTISFGYTNDAILDLRGSNISIHVTLAAVTNLDPGAWLGYGDHLSNPTNASFVLPLQTNITLLPDSYFRTEPGPTFATNVNVGAGLFQGFEQTGRFQLPQLNLSVSNRIRFILIDTASGRVVDYIQLSGLDGVRDLSSELTDSTATFVDGITGLLRSETIFWQTNRAGGNSLFNPPMGVINQIQAALGNIDVPSWNSFGIGQASGTVKLKEIDSFRVFCGLTPLYFAGTANTNLTMTVPFTPTRKTSQYLSWQANDPFVHFARQDLWSAQFGNGLRRESPSGAIQTIPNIGELNDRFEPWGGNPTIGGPVATPLFSTAIKDPLVIALEAWDSAGRGQLSFGWLGKVHRGTPWQTLYLKSSDVSLSTWMKWLGDWDANSAAHSRPVSDRSLVSALAVLLNTNSPASLLSINSTDTNAWLQTLDGLVVFTNSSTDTELQVTPPLVRFETNVMNSAWSQAGAIVTAILQTRSGATWTSIGNVLTTPELSEASPWLNTNSNVQLQEGISDEAYEAIASQLLPRLRQDSVGALVSVDGPPVIEFSGYDGFPYVVEVSADLVNWSGVSTNYPTNGKWRFTDASGADSSQRFYRSRLLP